MQDPPVGAAPPRAAGHLNSLEAATAGGRLTRFVAEGFTAKSPSPVGTVQDVALKRLDLSGLDLHRILALRNAGSTPEPEQVRAAIRSGDVSFGMQGLQFGPAVLDSTALTLTPAGTDHLALTGGRVGPQVQRPPAPGRDRAGVAGDGQPLRRPRLDG